MLAVADGEAASRVKALHFAYTQQLKANSALLARVQAMRGNILVCCRIRPFTPDEERALLGEPAAAAPPPSAEEGTCLRPNPPA